MGDIMRPIPFGHLMNWILTEYRKEQSVFGIKKIVRYPKEQALPIFGEKIETPFGPAAGPNTQLAQNIVAAYVSGARFFELKTVQKMDGEELAKCISKPCITAHDEGYNCEWSTELYVPQAFDEYVKAWVACKLLAKELDLGDPDGFVFNMSVGYDLDGIRSEKIDRFIEQMKDASGTEIFRECIGWALENKDRFTNVDEAFIKGISPAVSRSITESTLHGCPPDEIERIATYLLTEKHLNTFIKCNPTLLGYEYARQRLDGLGFDYIAFDDHHFREDLQWEDAVPMLERLITLAAEKDLEFGVKLTNTFPVDVKAGELPSEEMYMSGRSLFPLTVHLACRITEQFKGKLRISYSGGASVHNGSDLFKAGIWPITLATSILQPGGYERMSQICECLGGCGSEPFGGVDIEALRLIEEGIDKGDLYRKPVKPLPDRHVKKAIPLFDCFTAPCRDGCPIGQDIPAYLRAMEDGDAEKALEIILERNPLPFITGTICPHHCGDQCMRNYYEGTLHVRQMKLAAAEGAYEKALSVRKKVPAAGDKRVAIVGGGPAGLSAAAFLSRAGVPVTVFEKRDTLGGIVRAVIPEFRISGAQIDKDIALCKAYGAEMKTGTEVTSLQELKDQGYTDIIVAVGAWAPGSSPLRYGEACDAVEFLEKAKNAPDSLSPGTDVVVLGGGNTAMDTARAAKRLAGVRNVRLVYRRTKRYMPADEEELQMALDDGVEFMELLSPVGVKDGVLTCSVCELGEPDSSGRRSPVDTGRTTEVPATMVIAAVGERIDTTLFKQIGAALDEKGRPVTDENRMTTVPGIYAAGDCSGGPATVVEGIADAAAAAASIAGIDYDRYSSENAAGDEGTYRNRKGWIYDNTEISPDRRCLGCATLCGACAEVCPNRANVVIKVPGKCTSQIIHVDGMCNECGNCAVFCPYTGRPYRDKFTLFWSEEDFENSENAGFLITEDHRIRIRMDKAVTDVLPDELKTVDPEAAAVITAVIDNYSYLLKEKG